MNKLQAGLVFGIIAGILDVIPMILQNLTWDANLSAFTMWVVVGFFVGSSNLKFNGVLKGILIAFLVLAPCVVLISWKQPLSLVPIGIMTLILGSLVGFAVERFEK